MPPVNESTNQRINWRKLWVPLGLILTTLASIWPLFHSGLFVSDEELHWLRRLSEFDFAIRQRQWWPRWAANLEWGHGYPFFNFYAPACLWLSWPITLVSNSYLWGVKGAYLIAAFLSSAGMYRCLRPAVSRHSAFIGATLYLLAPYHTLNLYVRGNLAEYLAMGLFPWALWGLTQLKRRHRAKEITLAAVLLGCFQFAHTLSSLFGTSILVLWIALSWLMKGNAKLASVRIITVGLGTLLSAIYWLPAMLESKWVKVAELGSQIIAAQHVVYPWQYLDPRWGWEYSVPGPADTISFQVGIPHLLVVLAALVLTVRGRLRHEPRVWLILCLALLLVMTPLFAWFWALPILKMIQFPWRLLAWVAVATSLLGAHVVDHFGLHRRPWIAAASLGLVLTQLWFCRPEFYREVNEVEFWPEFTRNYFRGNTGEDDYLPIAVKEEVPAPSTWSFHSEGAVIRQTTGPYFHRRAEMLPSGAATVRYDVYHFPSWRVFVSGEPVNVRPAPDGTILFDVPPSDAQRNLELRWEATLLQALGGWISAGTLLALLGVCLVSGRRNGGRSTSRIDTSEHAPVESGGLP